MTHSVDALTPLSNLVETATTTWKSFQAEVARLLQTKQGQAELKACCQGLIDYIDGKQVNHSALPAIFCTLLKLVVALVPQLAPVIALLCP